MALTATIYNFDVELSDTDRHVYESLALRVARHPSESEEYLVTRVNANTLELYAVDRALVTALVARLERRVALGVSVTDRELYVSIGSDQLTGTIVRSNRGA